MQTLQTPPTVDCAEHTPTPWRQNGGQIEIPRMGLRVCTMHSGTIGDASKSDIERLANAAFIVRAVNAHEVLVKALEALKSYFAVLEGQDWRERELDEQAGAALRLARGA